MKSLATKIDNFFNEISNEHDVQSILNQVFLTLSESKKYGIDSVVESLYYQCIESETSTNGTNLENGWESNDGKHHLAVICVKNDDTQEHCFGEWIENAQGVIVLDKNRDNLDAEEKAKHFLQGSGYMVYATAESEIDDLRDCGYLIVKDGDESSNSIEDVVEYLETHDYEVFHKNDSIPEHLRNDGWYVTEAQHFEAWATDIFKNLGFIVIDTNKQIDVDAINKSLAPKNFKVFPSDSYQSMIEHFENNSYEVFDVGADGGLSIMAEYLEVRGYTCVDSDYINDFCIEHLTKEDYFVCQGGSDVESLVQLFHKEPEKFSKILMKSYKFKIDLPIKFDIDFEVKAFTLKEAHRTMRDRLENACLDVNNSQTYVHINADEIQIIPL